MPAPCGVNRGEEFACVDRAKPAITGHDGGDPLRDVVPVQPFRRLDDSRIGMRVEVDESRRDDERSDVDDLGVRTDLKRISSENPLAEESEVAPPGRRQYRRSRSRCAAPRRRRLVCSALGVLRIGECRRNGKRDGRYGE